MNKRLIILESPYAADTPEGVERNVAYARSCLRDSLLKGEAPIASHLLYTQPGVLDDRNRSERALGIEAGLAWGRRAEASVFYLDLGVTKGMLQGRDRALAEERVIDLRFLVMPIRAGAMTDFWADTENGRVQNEERRAFLRSEARWNEVTDDDRYVWKLFSEQTGHPHLVDVEGDHVPEKALLQLLADHRANGMSLMQARYQPNPLAPEPLDCVPEEPGRRRCATHGLPLYPDDRCMEGRSVYGGSIVKARSTTKKMSAKKAPVYVIRPRIMYAVWSGSVVFVRHPHLRELYIKTHPCVVTVRCPWNGCGAQIGEPCNNTNGAPKSETHYERRKAHLKKTKEGSR